ncbi:MAG: glycosyltransferase, partial [Hydrogenophaga sp.]
MSEEHDATTATPVRPDTDSHALLERLARQDKEIEQLNDAVLKLKEELKSAQKKLDDVHNSTSWRMTAFFRGPIMRLINLKRTWEVLAFDVASRGGWYDMLAEIGRDIRTHRLQYVQQIGHYLRSNGEHQPVPGSGPHDRNDYHAWRAAGKAVARPENARAPDAAPPLISVLIPTYKPPLDLLQQAIASVISQPYERWEICIADDASNDPALETYLRQLAQDNDRIHVRFRDKNGHISACTNTALALARGDYLLLLDQDDLLHPEAMQRVAEC